MSLRFNKDGATGFSQEEISTTAEKLHEYREHLRHVVAAKDYSAKEAAIILPHDDSYFEHVRSIAYAYQSSQLKYVIVVGIGGSNLGTKAIYEAVLAERLHLKKRTPELLFLETVNETSFASIIKHIESVTSPEEILVNIVSKSGLTTETIACFEALYGYLKDRFEDDAKYRIVVTTDEGSTLDGRARAHGCSVLYIPKQVGGRYSVFSAVGIFPLLLAGVDVPKLLLGARETQAAYFREDTRNDPTVLHASMIALARSKGASILNAFFFNSELESVGKWQRQLIGESLGKRRNKNGEETREGITPIVSVGSTDLHSVGQLYIGGPKDKFTSFIYAESTGTVHVPEEPFLNIPIANINGKSFKEIMNAIYRAVVTTYRNEGLPFSETGLSATDAYSIGAYMETKILEVMYLGHLWNIDAFDQPDVEGYKKITKEILQNPAP